MSQLEVGRVYYDADRFSTPEVYLGRVDVITGDKKERLQAWSEVRTHSDSGYNGGWVTLYSSRKVRNATSKKVDVDDWKRWSGEQITVDYTTGQVSLRVQSELSSGYYSYNLPEQPGVPNYSRRAFVRKSGYALGPMCTVSWYKK